MILLLSYFRFLLPKGITAITLWPFILFRDKAFITNDRIINHEKIHLRQQIELLVLPFYIFYLIEYILKLIYYLNHQKAYRNISFEKEAYNHENNLDYLQHRKLWAMWRN